MFFFFRVSLSSRFELAHALFLIPIPPLFSFVSKTTSGSYRDPAVVSMIEAHNARAMAGGPFEVLSVAVPPAGTAPYADGNVNVKPQQQSSSSSSSSSTPQVSTASAAVGGP